MNVLFVCSRNQWRSPTAETIYKSNTEHVVKSAGTEPGARVRTTAKLIDWADLIFAMEKRHKQRLKENLPAETSNKEIIILDITDDHDYMDEELVEMIKTAVSPYLLF